MGINFYVERWVGRIVHSLHMHDGRLLSRALRQAIVGGDRLTSATIVRDFMKEYVLITRSKQIKKRKYEHQYKLYHFAHQYRTSSPYLNTFLGGIIFVSSASLSPTLRAQVDHAKARQLEAAHLATQRWLQCVSNRHPQ